LTLYKHNNNKKTLLENVLTTTVTIRQAPIHSKTQRSGQL